MVIWNSRRRICKVVRVEWLGKLPAKDMAIWNSRSVSLKCWTTYPNSWPATHVSVLQCLLQVGVAVRVCWGYSAATPLHGSTCQSSRSAVLTLTATSTCSSHSSWLCHIRPSQPVRGIRMRSLISWMTVKRKDIDSEIGRIYKSMYGTQNLDVYI